MCVCVCVCVCCWGEVGGGGGGHRKKNKQKTSTSQPVLQNILENTLPSPPCPHHIEFVYVTSVCSLGQFTLSESMIST